MSFIRKLRNDLTFITHAHDMNEKIDENLLGQISNVITMDSRSLHQLYIILLYVESSIDVMGW